MSQKNPASFDDDDFVDEPRPKKGPSSLVWALFGLGGVALVAVAILLVYETRRATQIQLVEAQRARADAEAAQAVRGIEQRPALVEPSQGFLRDSLPERFKACRLDPIVRDAKWYFSLKQERFVLECGNERLPAELQKAFLDSDDKACRVEGNWQLVDGNQKLMFSHLVVDGKPRGGEVTFPIEPAGLMRVNLGSHQYNVISLRP
jgi:hypothetical protein